MEDDPITFIEQILHIAPLGILTLLMMLLLFMASVVLIVKRHFSAVSTFCFLPVVLGVVYYGYYKAFVMPGMLLCNPDWHLRATAEAAVVLMWGGVVSVIIFALNAIGRMLSKRKS